MSIQTQFFVWEGCTDIWRPRRRGKINFNISRSRTSTENYLEPTENQSSSRGRFSQGTQHCRFSKGSMTVRQTKPEEFERIFRSMFNDIDWTKKGNLQWMSTSEKIRDFAKRCPWGHWSFLCLGEEDSMERTITNLKDSGLLLHVGG